MKFIVFFIGVMLLIKGMELHRHRFRHGHQTQMTDPLRETDKSKETYETHEMKETVEMGNVHHDVQKDLRNSKVKPSPGNVHIEEIEPNMVQKRCCLRHMMKDVMPKPGVRKNKLVAKYGTNFRYLGIVKNGLDRVMVVTSIPIPRFENIKVKPINFRKMCKNPGW